MVPLLSAKAEIRATASGVLATRITSDEVLLVSSSPPAKPRHRLSSGTKVCETSASSLHTPLLAPYDNKQLKSLD